MPGAQMDSRASGVEGSSLVCDLALLVLLILLSWPGVGVLRVVICKLYLLLVFETRFLFFFIFRLSHATKATGLPQQKRQFLTGGLSLPDKIPNIHGLPARGRVCRRWLNQ